MTTRHGAKQRGSNGKTDGNREEVTAKNDEEQGEVGRSRARRGEAPTTHDEEWIAVMVAAALRWSWRKIGRKLGLRCGEVRD
ncbi:uncharacterized protein DS421_17g598940 [Arachis hypogaea]|nr:uncharacterized protein DS421_17g598940 [Arachis hypogaea]